MDQQLLACKGQDQDNTVVQALMVLMESIQQVVPRDIRQVQVPVVMHNSNRTHKGKRQQLPSLQANKKEKLLQQKQLLEVLALKSNKL